jgi:hypothetical protein
MRPLHLKWRSTGNVTVSLSVAFQVVIEFFSLLSEPITKLLGKFFVVEMKDILVSGHKSGSVSLSRFDLWLIVVDPSERRTVRQCHRTPDRPPPDVWVTCKRSRK